jgi:uncharacterized protein (DUF1015 family)
MSGRFVFRKETLLHLIRPFAGLRPVSGRAADVAAPPYDVLSTEEARARAAAKPWSFLHISKPEIDLAPGTDPYAPQVYAKAAENLHSMLAQKILERDARPCYYAYRLIMDSHVQIGLVAAAAVAGYDSNRIRKHEFTRPDKEDDRVRQIEALNAQTGPVLLAYPTAPEVDALLGNVTSGEPVADVTADTGVRHTLWRIEDPGSIVSFTQAFDAMPALYIADGHHRSAAASRVAALRRAANPRHDGTEGYNFFLAVAFPYHQLRILPYNRAVTDLNGLSRQELLSKLSRSFALHAAPGAVTPAKPGEFGLYLPGQWYRLNIHPAIVPTYDPVEQLDVSLLSEFLLAPLLGITDPRRDRRIDFIGGIRGPAELQKRVDSGEMAAAFSMFPTRMQDLMAVADVGEVMPPKSTWFEPKLADGLVSHVLD